MSKKAAAGMNI